MELQTGGTLAAQCILPRRNYTVIDIKLQREDSNQCFAVRGAC